MPEDYVTSVLHDATLTQICDELNRRFPTVILGIMRPDPHRKDKHGRTKTLFTHWSCGQLIDALGMARVMQMNIEDDLADTPETELDEGE